MRRVVAVVVVLVAGATAAPAVAAPQAPGAPGTVHVWAPADKHGFGTARQAQSDVFFTLRAASLTEVYFPDLSTPSFRGLQFAVTDGHSFVDRETVDDDPRHIEPVAPGVRAHVTPIPGSLAFRQVTETSRGLASSRYWALLAFRGGGNFATEAALTGRFFSAEEALAAGVIDRVAPPGEHLEQAYALARQIAANPPLSVRATVRTRRWYMDQAEREAYLQTTPLKLHLTEDFKESARAFAEKRPAGPFKGR